MDNKSRDIALHRYVLVREAADPSLTPAQRGELVRALAAVEHLGPDGSYVKVSRPTLDRWIRRWRAGGFDALAPKPRRSVPVIPRELLELAADLKREAPKRTAVQIAEIIKATRGSSPSARTIQRHFAMTGLNRTPDGRPPKAFGRFEEHLATQVDELKKPGKNMKSMGVTYQMGPKLAFDPKANRWSPLAPAPIYGRADPTAVWTGQAMIVWGGGYSYPPFADGAVFRPTTP